MTVILPDILLLLVSELRYKTYERAQCTKVQVLQVNKR